MKHYEAPHLFVDEYAADTMIASVGPTPTSQPAFTAKNGSPNNQNCYGYNTVLGEIQGSDICIMLP